MVPSQQLPSEEDVTVLPAVGRAKPAGWVAEAVAVAVANMFAGIVPDDPRDCMAVVSEQ